MAQNNGIRTVLAPPGQAVLAVGKLARKFLAIENIINYWGQPPIASRLKLDRAGLPEQRK